MKQRRASYTTTVLCVIVFAVTLCAVPCPGADAGTKKAKGPMDAGREEARKADEKLAEAKPAPAKGKDADNTNLLDFPNRMQLARADKESGNKPAPSPFRAATKEREVDLTQVTPRNTTWSAAATVGESKGDLAKQIQNPISDMISVPIQYNALFGMKPDNNAGHNLTIQPVIPIELNEDWNLINRPILTFDYLPSTRHGQGDVAGMGDLQYQTYFSPSEAVDGVVWGVGPMFQFPTATDDRLGTGNWCIGVGGVVLASQGRWVYGCLVNNLWSVHGKHDRDGVNIMTIQPFVNYNLDDGWYLTSTPIVVANWEASQRDRWTVPLGGGVGKIVQMGKVPVNLKFTTYCNLVSPRSGPDWTLQFQIAFLFPK